MATGVSTFNDITPALRDSYKRVLLDRAKKDLVFMQNADKERSCLHAKRRQGNDRR
jgi:hypothetical protein